MNLLLFSVTFCLLLFSSFSVTFSVTFSSYFFFAENMSQEIKRARDLLEMTRPLNLTVTMTALVLHSLDFQCPSCTCVWKADKKLMHRAWSIPGYQVQQCVCVVGHRCGNTIHEDQCQLWSHWKPQIICLCAGYKCQANLGMLLINMCTRTKTWNYKKHKVCFLGKIHKYPTIGWR